MKKILLYSTVFLVLFSCSDNSESDNLAKDFTGIYSGYVNRNNNYPPWGFEATIVNNTILNFRCNISSGSVYFAPMNNIEINNDGTFIMIHEVNLTSIHYTGSINSDFKISGTYLYKNPDLTFTRSFSGNRN
jgi:hypothetical protein